MPRIARLSRTEMADCLAEVFQSYGYEGASLSRLAEAAELSKASLYHHYPKGKEDMATHILARAGVRLQRLVLDPLKDQSLRPVDRLTRSFEGTKQYYNGNVPICLMNSLLLGEGRSLFGAQIGAAVAAWQKSIRDSLIEDDWDEEEANFFAQEAIARIQGTLVLCRVMENRAPLDDLLDILIEDIS